MENHTLKEKLIEMYQETLVLSKDFSKKTYEDQIAATQAKYQDLYKLLQEELESFDQSVEEIAAYVPRYASEQLQDLTKRKQELQKIDNNLAMVSYFVPLMGKIRSDKSEAFTDRLVEKWNEVFPDTKIGKSSAEQIQSGFKKGLCYITTAVCESLNRPDDCYELNLLRNYRDTYMMSTKEGTDVVNEYYNIAPTIVNRISKDADSKVIYRDIWSTYLEPCVHMIEDEKCEECQDLYTKMVHELEEKYLYS